MKHLAFSLGILFLAAACSPANTTVQAQKVSPTPAPVEIPDAKKVEDTTLTTIILDGGQSQLEFNPKVDILFVEDNSDSMKNKQENLFRSIDRFVSGFQKNRMIDYHIGVVSVWDSSERFATKKQDPFGIGELRFAKDKSGNSLKERFSTRQSGGTAALAASLKLGATPFEKGGPADEELFSPISAAITKIGRGDVNEGFFREDAQLVIVLMTDADDVSSIAPEVLVKELIDFKGGRADKLSVYGALVGKKDQEELKDWALRIHPDYHPECFDFKETTNKSGQVTKTSSNNGKCTEGFAPDRLASFIVLANQGRGTPDEIRSNYIISITQSNFGDDLNRIGSEITARTLEKEIFLDQKPRLDENGRLMIKVRYGTDAQLASGHAQLIPYASKSGWRYDATNNSIHLSGDIAYEFQDGAHFSVEMTPVVIR